MDARVLTAALVLASCGGSTTVAEPENGGATRAPAAGASCVASYAARPCELLTEAIVRAHATVTGSLERVDAEQRRARLGLKSKGTRSAMANGCAYRWKAGSAVVELRSIQAVAGSDPVATFENKWRPPTDAEREALARRIEQRMKEAHAEGKVSASGARAGTRMATSALNEPVSYEPVAGVGTAARWGGTGQARALMVLHEDTEFVVVVDVSEDEATNRASAIAVARELLAACAK